MVSFDRRVNINGVTFLDVTGQTVAGHVYNYEEAVAYTQGRHIAMYRNASGRPKKDKKK